MTLRLLLVHAHPDDETLNHGATVAAALAAGHEVDLVTCTRGEEGEVIGAEHAHRVSHGDDTLADAREAELAAALRVLGTASPDGAAVAHHWLDGLPSAPGSPARPGDRYRDSGMVVLPGGRAGVPPDVRPEGFAVADLDEAASRLAGLVVRRRPHVLLTYGAHGGYGHPDHVMAHRVALRALALADASWRVPWAYGAAGDVTALRRWLRRRVDPAAWDPDGPLPQMFVAPTSIDATVDASRWLEVKAEALRALPTQVRVLPPDPAQEPAFVLSNEVPQPLSGVEPGRLLRAVPGDADLPDGPVDDLPDGPVDDPVRALLLPPGTTPRP
ncbi:PIG-L family deacetylase [Aquipuribacter sp. MA13-6]|uniref:PIG-L family deacetylase n=1 Tax=Aquipuribacter sp. MA13-6 TaxID=3440839 RepID=UPI003EF0667F